MFGYGKPIGIAQNFLMAFTTAERDGKSERIRVSTILNIKKEEYSGWSPNKR